jgi:hypothetical protein
MRLTWLVLAVLLFGILNSVSLAKDDGAEKELTGSTKVILENDHVRVVRVTCGPHERGAPPRQYRPAVTVFLTDGQFVKTPNRGFDLHRHPTYVMAGQAVWETYPYGIENLTDQPFEAVRIELKDR